MSERTTSFPTSLATDAPRPALQWVHWICFASFLLALAWASVKIYLNSADAASGSVLFVAAMATTLVSLCRRLPVQNVLLTAATVGVIGIIAQACGAILGIIQIIAQDRGALGLFLGTISPASFLWMSALWIMALLNSRGAARLILWRWRSTSSYGYWLLGLTALLTVVFVMAVVPSFRASPVDNALHLAGLMTTAILMSILVTPAMIHKKPVISRPDYYPLIVWLLLTLYFGVWWFGASR